MSVSQVRKQCPAAIIRVRKWLDLDASVCVYSESTLVMLNTSQNVYTTMYTAYIYTQYAVVC